VKKLVASLLAAALVVVLTLSAVWALGAASGRIAVIDSAAWRLLAMVGAFGAGVAWLLATVYLATHIAVLIFGKDEPPQT
jgi:hypothetical protein